MKRIVLYILLIGTTLSAAAESVSWLRYPAISPDGKRVAFTYKGDIWIVSTQGGTAKRFTKHKAYDYAPIWSHDGTTIAFASNRYGNFDIFTAAVSGSVAKRVTTHSNDERPWRYSPDGNEIYYSANLQVSAQSRMYPQPIYQTELYASPVEGGRPRLITEVTTEDIDFIGTSGDFLYHDRMGGRDSEWRKHHTSSICRNIWIYRDGKHTRLTDFEGEDRTPRVAPDGKTIYYLSERDGSFNIYSFPIDKPSQITRITEHHTHPVRFLSIAADGTLCYGYHGDIYIKKLGATPRKVEVNIDDADQPAPIAPKQINISSSRDADVSPDGKQMAFVFRGNIFATYTNTDDATTRQITNTIAPNEQVSFSPDGSTLVYSTEREGAWNIYFATTKNRRSDFVAEAAIVEKPMLPNSGISRRLPQFSPDGKEVAYIEDKSLMVFNLKTKKVRCAVDKSLSNGVTAYCWSPDSKWFALVCNPNAHDSEVCLMRASGEGELLNITQSGYAEASPRWVMEGNALLFQTTRNGSYTHSRVGGSKTDAVMIVFLNRAAEERFRKTRRTKENCMMLPASERGKELVVEMDGISQRIISMTDSGNWGDTVFDSENRYFYATSNGKLYRHNLVTNEKFWYKGNAGSRLKWNDADKTLYMLGSRKVVNHSNEIKRIPIEGMTTVDREADRLYMFEHIYWIYKERFYVVDMHGIDWKMYHEAYRPFMKHINNNFDFAEMVSELVGEANVSHTGLFYNPPKSKRHDSTGELGLFLDWNHKGDGLKVDEIIARGPFDRSDTQLEVGDIITKIGESKITAGMDYYPLLNHKANTDLSVTIRKASGKEIVEVVRPITRKVLDKLLYNRWVKRSEQEVARLSNGRLGYLHIEVMQHPNYRDTYMKLFGSYGKAEGVVIDVRYNKGGRLHRELARLFGGVQYMHTDIRGVSGNENPTQQYNRPTIMLANEANYSNGFGTPYTYSTLKLGSLVGMPIPGTMTAVFKHKLRDKSLTFWIPTIGYRNREGKYLENIPLEPDIKVENKKEDVMQGRDEQLEVAVKTLLEQLPNNPRNRW